MDRGLKIYVAADQLISSLGVTTEENMDSIRRGRSGIREIRDGGLFAEPFLAAAIEGEAIGQQIKTSGLEAYTRLEQLFILAIGDVIAKSGIGAMSADCGMVFATTKGNIDRISTDEAYLWRMAERVAGYFDSPHAPVVISNACISGVSALITAARLIENGTFRHVIVAGGDLLTRFVVTGFHSFKSVSRQPCRPYDAERDGLTLGEACGAVVLTSDRSRVTVLPAVVVEGGAVTNDANHISGPSRTGDGLYAAITGAMAENGLTPGEISFVNAHGTATVYNDEMESKAIRLAGLEEVPLNSLKPYFGHTLGASGVIESIVCFAQLREGVLLGTKGFQTLGVPVPLNLSGAHRSMPMARCVKTASGFGGCNAAIVFALEASAKDSMAREPLTVREVAGCTIRKGEVIVNGEVVLKSDAGFGEFIRLAFKALERPDRKFYKMDDLCKLGYVAVEYLLRGEKEEMEMGIILANAASSLHTDREHQRIIDEMGDAGASPSVFVYTLPNVVMGELCIRHKIRGENTFFITKRVSLDFLKEYATIVMEKQKLKACICGWCELEKENYEAEIYYLFK